MLNFKKTIKHEQQKNSVEHMNKRKIANEICDSSVSDKTWLRHVFVIFYERNKKIPPTPENVMKYIKKVYSLEPSFF